uniref:Uncharacterized protein n=1 Tax=Calcidiscus leptoporus TaxID=127549 RepID=A0A7S0J0D0_9EUKA
MLQAAAAEALRALALSLSAEIATSASVVTLGHQPCASTASLLLLLCHSMLRAPRVVEKLSAAGAQDERAAPGGTSAEAESVLKSEERVVLLSRLLRTLRALSLARGASTLPTPLLGCVVLLLLPQGAAHSSSVGVGGAPKWSVAAALPQGAVAAEAARDTTSSGVHALLSSLPAEVRADAFDLLPHLAHSSAALMRDAPPAGDDAAGRAVAQEVHTSLLSLLASSLSQKNETVPTANSLGKLLVTNPLAPTLGSLLGVVRVPSCARSVLRHGLLPRLCALVPRGHKVRAYDANGTPTSLHDTWCESLSVAAVALAAVGEEARGFLGQVAAFAHTLRVPLVASLTADSSLEGRQGQALALRLLQQLLLVAPAAELGVQQLLGLLEPIVASVASSLLLSEQELLTAMPTTSRRERAAAALSPLGEARPEGIRHAASLYCVELRAALQGSLCVALDLLPAELAKSATLQIALKAVARSLHLWPMYFRSGPLVQAPPARDALVSAGARCVALAALLEQQALRKKHVQLEAALPVVASQDAKQGAALEQTIRAQLRECDASVAALPRALLAWIESIFDAELLKDVDARRRITAIVRELRA